jgi:iron complex transport system permease protein
MGKTGLHRIILIILLILLLTGAGLLAFAVGPAGIPVSEIFAVIKSGRGSVEYSILFDVRLPRILLGLAVGGALSLAGVVLQGMFRNPLVEPYTLGISGGAALGVSLSITFGLSGKIPFLALPASGFAGALAVIILVYGLSVRKGVVKIQQLLLTGVMISFISSSLIMFVLALSRARDLQGIIYWIMGSLQQPEKGMVLWALFVSLAGLAVSYCFCIPLNALSAGEEDAMHLGFDIEKIKKILFLISALLTGLAVSVAGVIGFVGLVIPHLMRLIAGSDHRILLVSSFLAGASFLILCDSLARVLISPLELPVGVITGIIGGVIFIYALSKRQVRL